jgi:hypothetical protein
MELYAKNAGDITYKSEFIPKNIPKLSKRILI